MSGLAIFGIVVGVILLIILIVIIIAAGGLGDIIEAIFEALTGL